MIILTVLDVQLSDRIISQVGSLTGRVETFSKTLISYKIAIMDMVYTNSYFSACHWIHFVVMLAASRTQNSWSFPTRFQVTGDKEGSRLSQEQIRSTGTLQEFLASTSRLLWSLSFSKSIEQVVEEKGSYANIHAHALVI